MARALGGRKALHRTLSTPEQVSDMVAVGLPAGVLEGLSTRYSISRDVVANVAGIARRTLARRMKDGTFSRIESDRLARIARVLVRAEDVLQTSQKAGTWIQRPNRALAGRVPLEELSGDLGTESVMQLLGRIDHGVFS